MKHLKTFEQYSPEDINEGIFGDIKKFGTGYENKEEKEAKKKSVLDQLDEIEAKVQENPEKWAFNRKHLEKTAEENNWRGELRTQRGGRDKSRVYVAWDNKATGLQNIAKVASNTTNRDID